MIKKIKIYGERCSGTNYLLKLLNENFDVELTNELYPGHKHFFGFETFDNTDDTLFIGIIRNPYDWLNCLYDKKHQLKPIMTRNITMFLTRPPLSYHSNGERVETDQHIYQKRNYKNIFELRKTKNHFLLYDMPHLVKNYILIRHEDLLYNFYDTMTGFLNKGLVVKDKNNFPINITSYIDAMHNERGIFYNNRKRVIKSKTINKKLDLTQEREIFINYLHIFKED
jgi:hypothetical protein